MQLKQHAFDGHCHSTASDGTNSPRDLAALAFARGLSTLYMTDHDTLNGYYELLALAQEGEQAGADESEAAIVFSTDEADQGLLVSSAGTDHQMSIEPGAELSCEWSGKTIHILAYGLDIHQPGLNQLLETQMSRRRKRADTIIERVAEATGRQDLVEHLPDTPLLARPHFAQALVAMGEVRNEKEAFSRYLGQGKAGDVVVDWPEMASLLEELAACGIAVSLAHPDAYNLSATRLRLLIEDYEEMSSSCELRALEVATPDVKQGRAAWLADLARKHELFQTAGSDYHGARTPWRRLGLFPEMPGLKEGSGPANCRRAVPSLFEALT
ncbi:PHP domain-containing protein [Allohahella marinimesophila]|uniref:PHP domain-containing protein n=1 Tax=Allohahella marinimesophila TaxID=1054972 RepID=A0ABP7NPQ1_9GAMM